MEPEQRLDDHVDRRGQIVAAADMRDFVRENRLDLVFAQLFGDRFRPHENRPQNAEDAGLERGVR